MFLIVLYFDDKQLPYSYNLFQLLCVYVRVRGHGHTTKKAVMAPNDVRTEGPPSSIQIRAGERNVKF